MKKLLALAMLLVSFAAHAAWQITPQDPQGQWHGYDIAIHCMADDGTGLAACIVAQRATGTNDWLSMGPNDGTAWTAQDFAADVAARGGFAAWWAAFLVAVNNRTAAWAATITAQPAAAADPATIQQFIAWLTSHYTFNAGPNKPTFFAK